MRESSESRTEPVGSARSEELFPSLEPVSLTVTFDLPAGAFRFEWSRGSSAAPVARGLLAPSELREFLFRVLAWRFEPGEPGGEAWAGHCSAWPASVHALLKRIRNRFPLADGAFRLGLLPDADVGKVQQWLPLRLPPRAEPWKWLGRGVVEFARILQSELVAPEQTERGQSAMRFLVGGLLGERRSVPGSPKGVSPANGLLDLRVTFDCVDDSAKFVWRAPVGREIVAAGAVRCTGVEQFRWVVEVSGREETELFAPDRDTIRAVLGRWLKRFPTNPATFTGFYVRPQPGRAEPLSEQEPPFGPNESVFAWIEDGLVAMAEALRSPFSPLRRSTDQFGFDLSADAERYERRMARKEEKRAGEAARRQANIARLAEERRHRDERAAAELRAAEARRAAAKKFSDDRSRTGSELHAPHSSKPPRASAPLPAVPVTIKLPPLAFQETAFPLGDLRDFALRERAALWWVSNQSDDLLCLPNCRIQRLEYQVRTALRVLGPLRGRALLSDEVGLGKTIEAGLVLKELLTRGMVKRFLVLTLPSLVDQWAEELNDKFGLATVTTNQAGVRDNAPQFWRESTGIVASLHTLKQPAHLEIARQMHWDLLIVDEAHYLRNRNSQAWQAVNVLPRQFLLLLTATPVQNSLEELYNLVTLLMPGQLPTPREFRARFLDPKRPRQPREPEELRRLLGQVMIRNTRANAGVDLPPRRAETVMFAPDEAESAFWGQWETEFRASLARLNASQASLWGRLLLRAAGSSPAAWRSALAKFPDATAARAWREQAPLEASWRRKCGSIVPLARGAGGVVLFTEFLETQAALAEFLRGAGVEAFVINGATPAPERQPITEQFRQRGGALVLTHSGTEGRNLQFCHCLANFDLPWNPMEIEQRIGRLHRLGQQHPVRIYNFVQAGTLQEHLLHILQDKLNLFELVVGETGLVLGERFSGDEFEEEVFRRWRESDGRVAEALAGLGEELAAARDKYGEVKKLDETLFAQDYESL